MKWDLFNNKNYMIMETKKEYIAPELTVVTVKSERGYSASSDNPLAALQMLADALSGLNGGNMESWSFDQEDQTFDDNTITWS